VRDRRAAFAALLVLVLAAGCGVSPTRRPVDLGGAAVAGPVGGGVVKEPAPPDDAVNPTALVELYLQAAVGADEQAGERVRRFFVAGSAWKPTPGLTVVRLIGRPSQTLQGDNRYVVTARAQRVGTLNAAGWFEPGTDPSPTTLRFTVVGQGTPIQWRLERADDGFMISDTALESLYQPSAVYFWNYERTHLVPDLRYVPLTMGVSERPNQVVDWQLDGPSPLLGPAVYFRPGAKRKERVAGSGDAVVVNLTSGAASEDPAELQRLTEQLRWTLRPYVARPLELRIEGLKQAVDGAGDAYIAKNAAAVSRAPALFSLDKDPGKVVARNGLKLSVLNVRNNANLSYAAVSPDPYDLAAFVGVNGRKLTIARTGTTAQESGKVREVPVQPPAGTMGRPVWIPGESEQFLVPAGGRIHVADAKSGRTYAITDRIGVTSVSVSPDGRRLALAAGGRAFVVALTVDRGTVSIRSQLRELVPERMTVNAVAWVSETKVLLAGASAANKAALFRVTADGAVAADESPDEAPLIDVIAFPDRTGGASGAGDVIARTAGAVFYVFSRSVQPAPELIRPFYAG
jgi:hypothetical protein